MPITKEILVLANSIKKGGRCVAGRELLPENDGSKKLGPWIRPIDPVGDEGTISNATLVIANHTLAPLDVIQIEFEGPANDPFHTEDWNIRRGEKWRRLGRHKFDVLDSLPDDAGDLWGPGSASSRRILPAHGTPTLCLIKPQGQLTVRAFMDETP